MKTKVTQSFDTNAVLNENILYQIQLLQECENDYIRELVGHCDEISRLLRKERNSIDVHTEDIFRMCDNLDIMCDVFNNFKKKLTENDQ